MLCLLGPKCLSFDHMNSNGESWDESELVDLFGSSEKKKHTQFSNPKSQHLWSFLIVLNSKFGDPRPGKSGILCCFVVFQSRPENVIRPLCPGFLATSKQIHPFLASSALRVFLKEQSNLLSFLSIEKVDFQYLVDVKKEKKLQKYIFC